MSWKTQPRDEKGRFIKQEVVKSPKKRKSKKNNKAIFSCFLLDNTASIHYNKMVDSLKNGYLEAVNAITNECNKNNIQLQYLLSKFSGRNICDYTYTSDITNIRQKVINYNPDGFSTAIYSNMINIINNIDLYLNYPQFVNKEVVVQLTVLTDGEDNASLSNDKLKLISLIKEKKELGWNISFMGSENIAESLEIDKSNILEYETTEKGSKKGMGIYTNSVSNFVNTVVEDGDTKVGFFVK